MNSEEMSMREAGIEDLEDLWRWRNDKLTRANSLNTEIISIEEHKQWYQQSLKNPERRIYIFEKGSYKIGMTRFDFLENKMVLVSININPDFRGRGLGKIILKRATDFIKEKNKDSIQKVIIKNSNKISEKIFAYCLFVKMPEVPEPGYSVWIRE